MAVDGRGYAKIAPVAELRNYLQGDTTWAGRSGLPLCLGNKDFLLKRSLELQKPQQRDGMYFFWSTQHGERFSFHV